MLKIYPLFGSFAFIRLSDGNGYSGDRVYAARWIGAT